MKTNEFYVSVTSSKLKENFEKQFGSKINLEKYSREQLEDMRNRLRTNVFQQESSAAYNDLLTNETYQKNQALLQILNTRIKEMLGEDFKKLKNKINELSEAKKGTRPPKNVIKAKGAKANKDYDGDGKIEAPKDEVWGSRAKAAAKAGKPFGKEKSVKENEETPEWDPEIEKPKYAAKKEPNTRRGPGTYGNKQPEDNEKDVDESIVSEKENPSAGLSKKQKSAVAKKAKAGKDIGKPGKHFKDVEAAAAKGGAKKPKAAAAAAMWKNIKRKNESVGTFKQNVRMVNESLARLLNEDEEGKAKAITAASDIVNDFTSWMQRVGQYQTKALIELGDAIRADFGAQQAEQFKSTVAPALDETLSMLTQQREAISNAVAQLAGEEVTEPMGSEPGMAPEEPGMEPVEPDQMNEPTGDEFGASDAAAGAGSTGREMRESKFAKRLAESHSIIAKLAK